MSNHQTSKHGQTLKQNHVQDGSNVQHDLAEKQSQKQKDKGGAAVGKTKE